MIGIYNYSVLFTLFGTMSGITGILCATNGKTGLSIVCLLLAGFFDMFDGFVARTRKNRSEFDKLYGVQLDSLSDVICFVLLPVFIAFSVTKEIPLLGLLAIPFFVAGISRLAWFNVEEELRTKKETVLRKTYTGLPVTPSSLILAIVYLLSFVLEGSFPFVFMFFMNIIALLNVSKIKFPHLKMRGLLICLGIGILIFFVLNWFLK